LYQATELNDLVATAYAWYWYQTNNTTYLTEGDDLFSNVWDSAGGQTIGGDSGWTYSVKEYNQIYKWSFDYVRWRSGKNADGTSPPVETVLAAANPYGGAWTDYTTPVQFEWAAGDNGNQPSITPVLSNANVFGTTVLVSFNIFKPNTTATIYYGTATPSTCDINNPQPPNCMQPYPNFGFLQMLAANYDYQSDPVVGVQNQTALIEGIPNIYDVAVTIAGLTPHTTYHWRPLTADSLGNMAAYNDQTFTTPAQDQILTPSAVEQGSTRPARDQVFTRPAGDQPCVDLSGFEAGQPVLDSRFITPMPAELLSSLTANCARR
jgi:hypothetical protein